VTDRIPLVDLGWQRDRIAAEVRGGWDRLLEQTRFIGGDVVTAFETEFAAACGVAHCIGVANGTDALEIALRAVGVGPGDEVALPANTFVATAFAALRVGARIRLFDVHDDTLLLDIHSADLAGCAAVLPVHLYGQMMPVDELCAAVTAPVVEDAAQAQGATRHGTGIGGYGIAAATSFYPGKNLGAYGDAGAVLCNDDELARRIRLLANHGSASKYVHETFGFNSRLDSVQSVVLKAKLTHLDEWNAMRREAAAVYDELLAGAERVQRLTVAPGNVPVWHLYPVRVPDRDHVLQALLNADIEAAIHYPVPVHLQPALASLGYTRGEFPVAERAADRQLSLPLYPGIQPRQQERVVEVLLAALR
jgi:dTDP-4-amino-4,6-dideoxygalactose transaminase